MSGELPTTSHVAAETRTWCLDLVNWFQLFVGFSYGLAPGAAVSARATEIRPPRTPLERTFLKGLLLEAIQRKTSTAARPQPDISPLVEALSTAGGSELSTILLGLFPDSTTTSAADALRQAIHARYHERLTVSELSAPLGLTPRRAEALFRHQYGVSPLDYIELVRVIEGVKLLQSGMKVDAVAGEVGYRGKRHFYRAIRRHTGKTPGRLRCDGVAQQQLQSLSLKLEHIVRRSPRP